MCLRRRNLAYRVEVQANLEMASPAFIRHYAVYARAEDPLAHSCELSQILHPFAWALQIQFE